MPSRERWVAALVVVVVAGGAGVAAMIAGEGECDCAGNGDTTVPTDATTQQGLPISQPAAR